MELDLNELDNVAGGLPKKLITEEEIARRNRELEMGRICGFAHDECRTAILQGQTYLEMVRALTADEAALQATLTSMGFDITVSDFLLILQDEYVKVRL